MQEVLHTQLCAHIRSFYSNFNSIPQPFTEGKHFLQLDRHFIRLALIEGRSNDKRQFEEKKVSAQNSELRDAWMSSYEDIHGIKQAISLDALFKKSVATQKGFTKRVLVYGRAGIGKSVLLGYLAFIFATTRQDSGRDPSLMPSESTPTCPAVPNWLSAYQMVFYLPLNRLSGWQIKAQADEITQLAEFIYYCLEKENKTYLNAHPDINVEQIIGLIRASKKDEGAPKLCFLLDGLDEARQWLSINQHTSSETDKAKHEFLNRLLALSGCPHIDTLLTRILFKE